MPIRRRKSCAPICAGENPVSSRSTGRKHFLTVQVPPVRIVIIGAVHISQAFAPMAKLAGFDCTIIDPRTAFASPERFPDVTLLE